MLVKLTFGVDFTKVLRAGFYVQRSQKQLLRSARIKASSKQVGEIDSRKLKKQKDSKL
jgi:hypothetical protein